MEVGPIVSRKAQFVPAFFSALNGGFTCHKQPNSTISNSLDNSKASSRLGEELAGIKEDEVHAAISALQKESFHDSVHVVRDYTRYRDALDAAMAKPS